MEEHGIFRSRELQRAAAQYELSHQHAYGVFALAGPLDYGRDQSAAVPPHHGCSGLTPHFTISKDGAKICIVDIRKILSIQFTAARVVTGECGAKLPSLGNAPAAGDGRRAA